MRHVALSVVLLAGCKGESEETPVPVEAPPAIAWVDVDTNAGLANAAAEAAAAGKGLMLDVRADWCVPCKELERDTFSQAAVRKALHDRFVAARLDVTDPSPDAEALQRRVGGAAMPWVVVWSMTDEDTKAFADGGGTASGQDGLHLRLGRRVSRHPSVSYCVYSMPSQVRTPESES